MLYAVMAECGYCPKDQLNTLRKLGSIYQGHPDVRFIPALEASTGSLGEGLSLALGMGLAAQLNHNDSRTYVVLGDGEIQEGQIWEAAMFAGNNDVDHVCAVIDYNGIQLDGFVKDIMDLEPIEDKWRSFGWHVMLVDPRERQQHPRASESLRRCRRLQAAGRRSSSRTPSKAQAFPSWKITRSITASLPPAMRRQRP